MLFLLGNSQKPAETSVFLLTGTTSEVKGGILVQFYLGLDIGGQTRHLIHAKHVLDQTSKLHSKDSYSDLRIKKKKDDARLHGEVNTCNASELYP